MRPIKWFQWNVTVKSPLIQLLKSEGIIGKEVLADSPFTFSPTPTPVLKDFKVGEVLFPKGSILSIASFFLNKDDPRETHLNVTLAEEIEIKGNTFKPGDEFTVYQKIEKFIQKCLRPKSEKVQNWTKFWKLISQQRIHRF